jgi:hypothetical protein
MSSKVNWKSLDLCSQLIRKSLYYENFRTWFCHWMGKKDLVSVWITLYTLPHTVLMSLWGRYQHSSFNYGKQDISSNFALSPTAKYTYIH